MIEQFHDSEGRCFNGASGAQFLELLALAKKNCGFTNIVFEECAAFSIAMVARSALGLTGANSKIHVFVDDSLFGLATLGAVRHLVNSGGSASVFLQKQNEESNRHLKILEFLGVKFPSIEEFQSSLNESHLSLAALVEKPESQFIEIYTESATPIHTVGLPIGANSDSGQGAVIFSSSTISLAVPLVGLRNIIDYVGRLYICDLSIPGKIYDKAGVNDVTSLFHSQPVVQIFPLSEDKLTDSTA